MFYAAMMSSWRRWWKNQFYSNKWSFLVQCKYNILNSTINIDKNLWVMKDVSHRNALWWKPIEGSVSFRHLKPQDRTNHYEDNPKNCASLPSTPHLRWTFWGSGKKILYLVWFWKTYLMNVSKCEVFVIPEHFCCEGERWRNHGDIRKIPMLCVRTMSGRLTQLLISILFWKWLTNLF